MKKALLIIGIVFIVACVIALLMALLFRHGYYNVLDGSTALYSRLHSSMIISFITAGIFAVIAVVCFIARAKM